MALALLLGAFALWWVWPRRKPQDRAEEARRLLGVGKGASADAIEAAFRQRLRRAHPDAGGSSRETQRLTEARALLLGRGARAED